MRPMTGMDEAKRPASRSPASLLTRPLQPYAEIFKIPGAWRFSMAAVIGRMPMSMFGLGTVLLISAVTGRYGVAGTVSAVGSLGYAFTSPRVARAVDSHGQRRVLLPLLTVFTGATALLIVLAPVYLLLGAMFVSIDLSTVAFAQHFGHKPLAGFILGTYALGSATGGIVYGTRHWRAPLEKRFAFALTLTVLGVATFWAQPNLISLTCVIYLCGLTIAPTLIAGFSLLEAQAKPGRRTEAMSWLTSRISGRVAA